MSLVSHDDLLQIHATASASGLAMKRSVLFVGLPLEFMSRIPIAFDPNAQLLTDLDHLNNIGAIADGSVPLKNWLSNALVLCKSEHAELFRRALAGLGFRTSAPPAPGVKPPEALASRSAVRSDGGADSDTSSEEERRAASQGLEWIGRWEANPQLDPEAPEALRALDELQAWLTTDESAAVLGWGDDAIDAFGLMLAVREWMRRHGLWIDPPSADNDHAQSAPRWYVSSPHKPPILCQVDWARALSTRDIGRAALRARSRAGAHQALVILVSRGTKGLKRRSPTLSEHQGTGVWIASLTYPEPTRRGTTIKLPVRRPASLPAWLPEGYFDELRSRCSRLDPVLVRQERAYRRRIEQAIELTLAYREESTAYPALALLQEQALAARDAVILGAAGSGKTTLARGVAVRAAEPDSPWIPILLPLGRYRRGELAALLEQAGLGDCRRADGAVDADRFSGCPFLFLLDGYDELSDRDALFRELEPLRGPWTRVIVTGRFLGDLRHRLPYAAFLAVRPLSPSQIEAFVRVFEGDKTPEIVEWIRRRGLEREARRPLWLIFILLVRRARGDERAGPSVGPIPLGQVYRLLIEHYFLEQWEASREGIAPEVPPAIVSGYLSEVALHMGWFQELSVRRARLESLYDATTGRWSAVPFERLIEQITSHQLLLYEAGEYFFPHRSFQEYFAALGLARTVTPSTFADHLDEYWKDTVRLLMGLLPAERAAALFEHVDIVPQRREPGSRAEPEELQGFGRAEILAEIPEFVATPE